MSGFLVASRLFSKARTLFFGLLLIYTSAAAQSAAYKVLLEGLYNKSFPTVSSDQITDLSNYQTLYTREKDEFEEVTFQTRYRWAAQNALINQSRF